MDSFTLMYPGTGGPVPGYDPITNNATINLFLTGTNLSLRANSSPTFDFGSVAFSLTGPTAQSSDRQQLSVVALWRCRRQLHRSRVQRRRAQPDGHALSRRWRRPAAPGIPASVNFTVVNTVVITNHLPTVTLTNPVNAATFTAPATLTLQATAADDDGSVTNVEFYAGDEQTRREVPARPTISSGPT